MKKIDFGMSNGAMYSIVQDNDETFYVAPTKLLPADLDVFGEKCWMSNRTFPEFVEVLSKKVEELYEEPKDKDSHIDKLEREVKELCQKLREAGEED